jgi:hypothetical protein
VAKGFQSGLMPGQRRDKAGLVKVRRCHDTGAIPRAVETVTCFFKNTLERGGSVEVGKRT